MSLCRPFDRLALITARPPGVRIRRRKPCRRNLRRLFPFESIRFNYELYFFVDGGRTKS